MTKKGRRIFGFFGLAFGSFFLIVGLGVVGVAIKRGLKQKATSGWPSVEGTILSTELRKSDDKGADSPLMYEFQLNGSTYRSTKVAFIDRSNIDYNEWIQLANGLPREGSIAVYYHPDNPNESVLVSGDVKASWNGLGFGTLFAGFAAFWMTAWWGMSNWLPDRLSKETATQNNRRTPLSAKRLIYEMEAIQPEFPALHIHEDGSVGALRSLDYWTDDVDQWFWSSPGEYLIDSKGLKFVQEFERDPDGRPVDVPTWRFDSKLDETLIRSLLASELGDALLKQNQDGDSEERIRAMIYQMVEHDER